MVRHTLHVDNAKLNGVGMGAARKLVTRTTRRVFNRSQVLVPVDQGYLRATGKMSLGPRGLIYVGVVEYTADYAAAVHNGRRALTIRAKGGGRLRFIGRDGRVVFARSVHQPARAPRPYLSDALREVATAEGFRVTIG